MKAMKKSLALLMILIVCLGLFSAALLAEEPAFQIDKSKTADPVLLNHDQRQTEVTLSMPSGEYQNKIDIVFAMDSSSSAQNGAVFEESVNNLFNSIIANNPNVELKVGVIRFRGRAHDAVAFKSDNAYSGLTVYSDATKGYIMDALTMTEAEIKANFGSGSNTHAGIDIADEWLKADKAVEDDHKYLILLTDCKTYIWNDENNNPTTIYSQWYRNNSYPIQYDGKASLDQIIGYNKYDYPVDVIDPSGKSHIFVFKEFEDLYNSTDPELTGVSEWDQYCRYADDKSVPDGTVVKHEVTNGAELFGSNSATYGKRGDYQYYFEFTPNETWEGVKYMEANPFEVIVNEDGTYTFDTTKINPNYYQYHVDCLQKGMYKAAHLWTDVDESYHCAAITYSGGSTGGGLELRGPFVDWMQANSEYGADIQSSAQVEALFSDIDNDIRYMVGKGVVTDEVTDPFDLVMNGYGENTPFSLTVGGTAMTAAAGTEANSWTFGTADSEGVFPYTVSWDSAAKEFTWNINVPIENINPVQLKYKLEWNFSGEENVPTDTNGKTELTYRKSVSTSTEADGVEAFESPKVTYIPETVDISVVKFWKDVDDLDGLRPDSIFVDLLADGVATGKSIEISKAEDGSWSGAFEGLAKYNKEAAILYTIVERAVDGYLTALAGDMDKGFTITNTHQASPVKHVYDSENNLIDDKIVKPGDVLTYNISYTNVSGEAVDLEISDTLPGHTTYVENSATGGGTLEGHVLTWNASLEDNASITVSFRVTVDDDVNGDILRNRAFVDVGDNIYTTKVVSNPTAVQSSFGVTKELSGRDWLADDAFTFTLSGSDGAPMPASTTATATAEAKTVSFDRIVFDKAGDYTYTVKEMKPEQTNGISYDESEKTVTVKVTEDPATGTLSAVVDPAEPLTFSNEYKVGATTAEIKVQKELKGRDWLDSDAFTFTLTGANGAPMPASATAKATAQAKTVSFGEITYKAAGEYTYTVKETVPANTNGISYDTSEQTVTVKVTEDPATGTLSAVVAPAEPVTFSNEYKVGETTAEIKVQKDLRGCEWPENGSFEFTLSAAEGTPMPENTTAKAEAQKTPVSFGEITYTAAGEYTYTIKEIKPAETNGIKYDKSEKTVTVKVTEDPKTGTLSAAVSPAVTTVVNKYEEPVIQIDKSKTADPVLLNHDQRQTEVTLSMPSGEYQNKIDIVFAMDSSSSAQNGAVFEESVNNLFNSIIANNPNVELKVGVIRFRGRAHDAVAFKSDNAYSGLTVYSDASKGYIMDALTMTEAEIKANFGSGSNTHGGIDIANEWLKADTAVDDNNKYLILLTDGKTYIWNDENHEPTTIYSQWYRSNSFTIQNSGKASLNQVIGYNKYDYPVDVVDPSGRSNIFVFKEFDKLYNSTDPELTGVSEWDQYCAYADGKGTPDGTVVKHEVTNGAALFGSNSATYGSRRDYQYYYEFTPNEDWEGVKYMEANPFEVIVNEDGTYTFDTTKVNPDYYQYHVDCLQKGIYKAAHLWTDVNESYHCAAITYTGGSTGGGLEMVVPFAGWLQENSEYGADINTSDQVKALFNDIDNDIRYTVGRGIVTDEVTDPFDLVMNGYGDNTPFSLTVGGTAMTAAAGTEANSWTFGTADSEGVFPYTVSWDSAAKKFTWNINVPIENANPVQLKYKLEWNFSGEENVPTDTNGKTELTYWESTTTDPDPDDPDGVEPFESPQVTYIPDLINISVVKFWEDAENSDGIRPDSIFVDLYADGVKTDKFLEIKAGENDKWADIFKDLAKYNKEAAIVYTIVERAVDGYLTALTGDMENGFTITNSHQASPVKHVYDSEHNLIDDKLVKPGDVLTYEITFTNNSGKTLDLEISDTLPGHTTYVENSATGGGTPEGNVLTWNASLEDGKDITVSFQVTVDDDVNGEILRNRAFVDVGDNIYTTKVISNPTAVQSSFGVTKELSGRDWLADDAFTFTLTGVPSDEGVEPPMPESNTVTATATAKTVSFDRIVFDKAGDYTYTVKETKPEQTNGISYDESEKTVTVTVTEDEATGQLSLTTAPADPAFTFSNEYKVGETSAEIKVQKDLKGRDWLEGETFSFELSAAEGTPMPESATVKAEGQLTPVSFGKITYTAAGEYTYTLKELVPEEAAGGVTYDTSEQTVTVKVTEDPKTGTLSAVVDPADAVTFSNEYKVSETTAEIKVQKDLKGREWLEGETFSFELSAEEGTPMPESATVKAEAQKTPVSFGEITYTAAGEYTYTLKEIVPEETNGVSYDTSEQTVSVKVTEDPKTGTLSAVVDPADAVTFSNEYKVGETSAEIKVQKDLKGRDWLEGETFSFELSAAEGTPMPESATATAEAQLTPVSFGEITYTAAGDYTYTLKEIVPTEAAGGVTYDTSEQTVTVKITEDPKTGTLSAVVDPAEPVTFSNEYTAGETTAEIKVQKDLKGRDWLEGETFTFELSAAEGTPMPESTTVKAEAQLTPVSFGKITYTAAGDYTYTLKEVVPEETNGVSYDTSEQTVTVKVTEDPAAGTLSAVVDPAEPVTFSNEYTAGETTAEIKVQKDLKGRDWLEGETFTFELSAEEGTPMPESATVKAEAQLTPVSFGKITYTAAGDYTYTVKEKIPSQTGGVVYDTSEQTVTVKVTEDPKTGTLSAVVDPADAVTFSNEYKAGETTAEIKVQKDLKGRDWEAGETFSFELSAEEGTPMPESATATAEEQKTPVSFGKITYTAAGEYTYTLKEIIPAEAAGGVTYDTSEQTVTVKVTEDPKNGTLSAAVDPELITFVNSYEATAAAAKITAKKVLTGGNLKGDDFSFELKNSEGQVLQTKTNDIDGNVIFNPIEFAKTGIYTYTISEIKAEDSGDEDQRDRIDYDKNLDRTVKVVVSDDLSGNLASEVFYPDGNTFNNTYIPPLNKDDHFDYIIGYPDGLSHPEGLITRAEVCTIFFRLLDADYREEMWMTENPYSDVKKGDWFNNAVSTMTNCGVINGCPDGTFRPTQPITRAEFATISVRFFKKSDTSENIFSDIDGHWAKEYILMAVTQGLIYGDGNGRFRPNDNITRAETMAIVNRVLERHPHKDHFLPDMHQWPDNQDPSKWYYADVQEATNNHNCKLIDEGLPTEYEEWTEILPHYDWSELERRDKE